MESITFNIEDQHITYEVNWLGMETISVNGNIVSKKLSLPNRKHKFSLEVYGKTEDFYIQSKQAFSSGCIKVQLFHNAILIEENTIEFKFSDQKEDASESNNEMFIIGIMFIVCALCFDWSKFFLFIGLIFLFDAVHKTHKMQQKSKQNNNKQEVED